MEAILQVEEISKKYTGFSLEGISLSLPRGYIMGLIGPNGAGKTTVIKLVMNLIRRDSGRIMIFGLDNLASEEEVKSRIGYVCDEPHYYDDVRLADTTRAFSPFYKTWDQRYFLSLVEEFELPMGKKFKTLSSGMRVKFSLAMALAHRPELLVMDEPTTGLDPVFRRKLLDRLAAFIEDGERSVLYSTHITSDLEASADYVTFINEGRIVFEESLEEIRESWAVVKGGSELLAPEYRPLLTGLRTGRFGVEALTAEAASFRGKIPAGCVVEPASLEEIMYYVKKEGTNGR